MAWPDGPGLRLGTAEDGELVGDAEEVSEPVGDGDGLGDALGEVELALGLGLGELDGLEEADLDGFGVFDVQVGEAEAAELATGPGFPFAVVPLPGPDEDDIAPPPPVLPPWVKVCVLPCVSVMTEGSAAIAQEAEATTKRPVASAAAGRSQPSRSVRPGSGRNLVATAPKVRRSHSPGGPSSPQSGAR